MFKGAILGLSALSLAVSAASLYETFTLRARLDATSRVVGMLVAAGPGGPSASRPPVYVPLGSLPGELDARLAARRRAYNPE